MKDWRYWLSEQQGTLTAIGIFVLMFAIYATNHPAGFGVNMVQTAANKGVLLAFVALATGLACGAPNVAIVIFGRLQPIVTTIATGAMFYGIALFLRPNPGGS